MHMNPEWWLHGREISPILQQDDLSKVSGRGTDWIQTHWILHRGSNRHSLFSLVFLFFFCHWHWALCKGRKAQRTLKNSTTTTRGPLHGNEKNKKTKNIPLHVSTLFTLVTPEPHKNKKVPVCVHCRCTYCELQVKGHSAQCDVSGGRRGPTIKRLTRRWL